MRYKRDLHLVQAFKVRERGDWGYRWPYWCVRCNEGKSYAGRYQERETLFNPGWSEDICPDCGEEINSYHLEEPNKARAIRRYTAWTKPNSDRARLSRGEQMLPFVVGV